MYTFDNETIHYFEQQYNELQTKKHIKYSELENRLNQKKKNQFMKHVEKKNMEQSLIEENKQTSFIKTNFSKNFDFFFWCFYILHNDFETFQEKNSFKEEQLEKFRLIEVLKEKKDILKPIYKTNKFKINISEMINDLGSSIMIDESTFYGLCFLLTKNIALTKNKIMKLIQNDTSSHDYITIDLITKTMTLTPMKLEMIQNKYFIVDNLEKPIKSEGTYKVDDLRQMASLFNVDVYDLNGKLKTKKILYQDISRQL